jgi:hypothetical protein
MVGTERRTVQGGPLDEVAEGRVLPVPPNQLLLLPGPSPTASTAPLHPGNDPTLVDQNAPAGERPHPG